MYKFFLHITFKLLQNLVTYVRLPIISLIYSWSEGPRSHYQQEAKPKLESKFSEYEF